MQCAGPWLCLHLCTIIILFFELKWNASFMCTYLLFVVRQLGFATLIVLRCGLVWLTANSRILLVNYACTRLWFNQRTSWLDDDLLYRPYSSKFCFCFDQMTSTATALIWCIQNGDFQAQHSNHCERRFSH